MAIQPVLIIDPKVLLLRSGQSLEMETQWCWVRGEKQPFASHLITNTPVFRLLLKTQEKHSPTGVISPRHQLPSGLHIHKLYI